MQFDSKNPPSAGLKLIVNAPIFWEMDSFVTIALNIFERRPFHPLAPLCT